MRLGRSLLLGALSTGLLLALTPSVIAQMTDDQAAQAQAEAFMVGFGKGQHQTLYRKHLGKKYRDQQSEQDFVAQYSMVLQQAGGPGTGRKLIDSGIMDQLASPNGMIPGPFYFFLFKTKYPSGNAYESVNLEQEPDGKWRVVGVWLNPAPR